MFLFAPTTSLTTTLLNTTSTTVTTLASATPHSFGPYTFANSTGITNHTTLVSSGTGAPQAISTMGSGLVTSINGQCGGTQTCLGIAGAESCSEWGWCGSGSGYAGPGCQPAFGVCDSNGSSVVSAAYPIPTTLVTITFSATTTTTPLTTSISVPTSAASPPSYTTTAPPASSDVPYKVYSGTGEVSDGWPSQDQWLTFDALFETNQQILSSSCAQWNVPDNSEPEIAELKSAIQYVAQQSGIDERFILAIVLQESNGCVRVPTTTYSVSNPGLMQTYNGKGTCNSGTADTPNPTTPCPASEITSMITEGVQGTGAGSMSLKAAITKAGCTDTSKYYKAARIYNSGSIASTGLLQDGVATHCYSSDIANRVLGWNGDSPSTCTFA